MVRQEKRLVLHFDVNKTLIIADPAMGIEMTEMINSLLAECGFYVFIHIPLPDITHSRERLPTPVTFLSCPHYIQMQPVFSPRRKCRASESIRIIYTPGRSRASACRCSPAMHTQHTYTTHQRAA